MPKRVVNAIDRLTQAIGTSGRLSEIYDAALVGDVAADPSLAAYKDVFARERIAALAFVTLTSEGRVVGKFMLYREMAWTLSRADVQTASTIGALVGFAVERTRVASDAETRRRRLLFALDAASMGTWEWDIATQRVQWG